jgi:UDP-galactopyranose mutase
VIEMLDKNEKYDYLIVGAGLFGATIANKLHSIGKKVMVIEKRNHIAGNIYTENIEGIQVHKYGAHIFHTDYKDVWDFVNSFVEFNRYTNSPVARFKNEIYNMPFNMNTFCKIWDDVVEPKDAIRHIEEERKEIQHEPSNLEEQAISLVGRTIYEKLVKGYTEKQWNRDCKDLPAFIIKRLPVRFVYDNNYFDDKYQGIPIGGYTKLVEKMLNNIEVKLNVNYFDDVQYFNSIAYKIIYTGPIDEYFHYSLGELEWRSLKFDTKVLDISNLQGNAVVNYTGHEVDFTRVIEHKFFEYGTQEKTVVTYEYPADYEFGMEKYYTINDDKNNLLADRYKELAKKEENVIFGGRLAEYKYYDMDDVIKSAFDLFDILKGA